MVGYVVAAAAAVAALFILVRLLEPRVAFFPLGGETTTPRDCGFPFDSLTIETEDGERLRAWFLPSPSQHLAPGSEHVAPSSEHVAPSTQHLAPLVVYFHGNGGHLSMWAPILCNIARQGYSVLAFDYRGYGVSTGRPTERGLYKDVDAIIGHVRSLKWSGPIVYWGRSLGVSMAAYAATRHPPAGLILESGFPDARSLFRAPSPMALLALFSTYRFPAADYLRSSKIPTLVMHGDADSVIPYEQSRALYERIGGPKAFFAIKGGDHNDAAPPDARAYWTAVNGFVDKLVR